MVKRATCHDCGTKESQQQAKHEIKHERGDVHGEQRDANAILPKRSGKDVRSRHGRRDRRQHDRQSHTLPGLGVATALHHRLLNSGLDRLEADVPSHSLARARVGC
jgi:hypothetical protein